MTWHLLEFEKEGSGLKADFSLPAVVDDELVKSLVGDHPNLKYDVFPLGRSALSHLLQVFPVEVNEKSSDYFLEYGFSE